MMIYDYIALWIRRLQMRNTRFSHWTQDVRKDNTGLMCKWHWQSHRKTSLLERDSHFAPTSTLFKKLFNEASICSVPAQPSEWCAIDTPLCCLSKESFCSLCNYRGTSQLYLHFFFATKAHTLRSCRRTTVRGLWLGLTGLMMATSTASAQSPVSLPFQTRFGNDHLAVHPAVPTGFSFCFCLDLSSVWHSDLINIHGCQLN